MECVYLYTGDAQYVPKLTRQGGLARSRSANDDDTLHTASSFLGIKILRSVFCCHDQVYSLPIFAQHKNPATRQQGGSGYAARFRGHTTTRDSAKLPRIGFAPSLSSKQAQNVALAYHSLLSQSSVFGEIHHHVAKSKTMLTIKEASRCFPSACLFNILSGGRKRQSIGYEEISDLLAFLWASRCVFLSWS